MAQLLRFCRKNLCAHSRAQPQLNERLQRWNTTAHTTLGAAALQRFDPRIDVLRGPAACVHPRPPPLLDAAIEPAVSKAVWASGPHELSRKARCLTRLPPTPSCARWRAGGRAQSGVVSFLLLTSGYLQIARFW